MAQRSDRARTAPPTGDTPPLTAEFIHQYCLSFDWRISACNILVEGDTDVKYLNLAAAKYLEATGLKLIGDDVSICGSRIKEEGGTWNLVPRFKVLCDLLKRVSYNPDERELRFLVLLDSDPAGKKARGYLTHREVGLAEFKHVFMIQRRYPQKVRDTTEFRNKTAALNIAWENLDCEMEDLIPNSILQGFFQSQPQSCTRAPMVRDNAHHYEWAGHLKPALFRYVSARAKLSDVQTMVELLQSLRYALGLTAEGSS